jgi:SAM-dependent methyltransferase
MLLNTLETDSGIGTSAMSLAPVREFYTSHPYPPPVENLDRARDEWRDENRLRAEYHLIWSNNPYRADLDVLVAGCGTWQAAKYALCHPAARVLGIDVSPTSLNHTEKLKNQYNLTNLETRALPIENAEALERRFDLIVCTGVIHHLVDPDAGLRALRTCLKPEGALYLMVYAPYGRAGVYMLQEYCRRLGIGTSPEEIGDLATVVEALPTHHPLAMVLRGARESLNADALADALLNPRDQSYSVPQLFEFIDRNGLKFGRWYWQAAYLPQCGAISSSPHANRLAVLSQREQSAAMELFRGTMTCHSAILFGSETNIQFHFDDTEASRYVPIRLPWTICVEERLPPGAAGVLLNQSHPFHDLILIIGAQQKRMFDAIDGRRTIAEIADHARVDGLPRAHAFFEKLWRYDQVVFSATSRK